MEINFEIGQAEVEWSTHSCSIGCVPVRDWEHECPQGNNTGMGLSYSGFEQFKEQLKVTSLFGYSFYIENGDFDAAEPLTVQHPGAMPILKEHCEYFDAKLAAYRLKEGRKHEWIEAAEWFSYWLNYAATHCEEPVFVNY